MRQLYSRCAGAAPYTAFHEAFYKSRSSSCVYLAADYLVELPKEWVEKAEFFRREARRHLREGVYWAACFEAQQAAELYLKALQLALLGIHEFTHDLSRLLEVLREVGIEVPRSIDAAADALTPHYTMARYPGRKPVEYSKAKGERCVEYMEEIVEWVLRVAERAGKEASGDEG